MNIIMGLLLMMIVKPQAGLGTSALINTFPVEPKMPARHHNHSKGKKESRHPCLIVTKEQFQALRDKASRAPWKSSIMIKGTEGSTNTRNTIWNNAGEEIYSYSYKNEEDKKGMVIQAGRNQYEQEHVDLITAIRTGNQIVEAEDTARSNLTCIMGRESAYAGGEEVTWEKIMSSNLQMGPEKVGWGPVDFDINAKVPG